MLVSKLQEVYTLIEEFLDEIRVRYFFQQEEGTEVTSLGKPQENFPHSKQREIAIEHVSLSDEPISLTTNLLPF